MGLAAEVRAAAPAGVSFQGLALDPVGGPINGTRDLVLRIFDDPLSVAASDRRYQETHLATSFVDGVFSVVIGTGSSASGPFGADVFGVPDLWLEVQIAGEILAPRTKLQSVPFALRSVRADLATSAVHATTAGSSATATSATTATNATSALNAQNAQNAVNATHALNATNAQSSVNATTAVTAQNALQLAGVAGSQYVQTTDPRLSDARPPTPGSASYVQNGTSQQAATSFNVSGNGTVGGTLTGNVVNATSHYAIGSQTMLAGGGSNVFAGRDAGENSTGNFNSFFGAEAGDSSSGSYNSFFGGDAGGNANTSGWFNSFFGYRAGGNNTTGESNSFFGLHAGDRNTVGGSNAFFGVLAGALNTTGSGNTMIGTNAFVGAGGLTDATALGTYAYIHPNALANATAIGARATVQQSDSLVLGSISGINGANATVNVGIGTATPFDRLHVNGMIRVVTLGAAGSTDLCRNANNQIASCSSSLRYKTRLAPFAPGLALIDRLQPISFDWKDGGPRDLGLVAEEVAAVEPLLVTHGEGGEVEGVKYDRLGVVLVNAVKEQQSQLDAQGTTIRDQQQRIDELQRALCSLQPDLGVCGTGTPRGRPGFR